MSYAQTEEITVTTDSDGDATAYTTKTYNGPILNIIYTKVDYADGVDIDVTTETTGQTVWSEDDVNTSKTVAPRQATHDTDGAVALYTDSGEPVVGYIWAVNERLKITIAQGGDTKSGKFRVIVG